MFTTQDFVTGQVLDLKNEIILANPKATPFTTFMMSKEVDAQSPVVSWIEETINESSATSIPEGGDAPAHQKDDSGLMENYLELFAAQALVSDTAQASNAVGIADLLAKDIAMKTEAIKRRIEVKLLYGTKVYAGGKYETAGIFNQIHANNKVTDTALSATKLEETLSKIYDAGVSYNMIAFCSAYMKNEINKLGVVTLLGRDQQLGFDTNVYSSAFGDITFIDVPMMDRNDLLIVNPDFLELATLIPFQAKPEPVSGSKQAVFLQTQLGAKLLNSKSAASLKITV
ncbi:DUF5309 family protein [Brevibacillus agri]|uniref:SU10 major capsid protein n=1 Tax=Brevibacillus agri TaxID=51101 RepID=UPI0004701F87|nr:DUF5309 family protein [Brevibacillus agri]